MYLKKVFCLCIGLISIIKYRKEGKIFKNIDIDTLYELSKEMHQENDKNILNVFLNVLKCPMICQDEKSDSLKDCIKSCTHLHRKYLQY